jgi:cell division protein FtsX
MILKTVAEKVKELSTKVGQKFRRGDHEKGFIGAGAGATLVAVGSSNYLGNIINQMASSLTNGSGSSTNIGGFVNDVVLLIGVISVILGIVEYRRLRAQIPKE